LLGACKIHHEVELGRIVADKLFKIEANDIGNYIVLSNLYAADARWDEVTEVRKTMRDKDLKKPAGCSWIEVERTNNIFVVEDCSHPQRSLIYSTLYTLDQQVKESVEFYLNLGYVHYDGIHDVSRNHVFVEPTHQDF
jgi:intein/homing endonuclease